MLAYSALLLAHAAQPPASSDTTHQIASYKNDNDGIGTYKFSYDVSDGSRREEEGNLVNPGKSGEYFVVRGSYSYFGPDGILYKVNYIADKNGFQPRGVHIPQLSQEVHTEEKKRPEEIGDDIVRIVGGLSAAQYASLVG